VTAKVGAEHLGLRVVVKTRERAVVKAVVEARASCDLMSHKPLREEGGQAPAHFQVQTTSVPPGA